ncbi:MAG: thioredoxin domain-containing protein [Chloroflexi bacterium]|nr:thioredoxin domain-containing protein [Chloroflexota bacterium]
MLGAEPQIIENYVNNGQVKIIFWHVLDHGNASLNSHAAADCIGQQSVDAYWAIHDQFFAHQDELWNADREYFIAAATAVGVDKAIFGDCYDNGIGQANVTRLDAIRRDQGILTRPSFAINDIMLFGAQRYEVYAEAIESAQGGE